MNTGAIWVRSANEEDIDYIMTVERLPGYAELVGCWSRDEHMLKMRKSGYAYLLCLADGEPAGFAILKDIGEEMGNLCLHRIAMGRAGKGIGTSFMRSLCDRVFRDEAVYRFWLDVLPDNSQARHVYRKVGFVDEGIMRQALRYPDGRRADLLLMSVLRSDWPAFEAGTA